MANQNVFGSNRGALIPPTDKVNNAGGAAYEMSPEHKLAQYVVTGCLNDTYYVEAVAQLETVKQLCEKVSNLFIAQCALYARRKGFMKDMPALLIAILAVRNAPELDAIFEDIIDNGKMLRNFVQIIRSGVLGRKSFGSSIKKRIQNWITCASTNQIISANIGNSPSLVDIIRMVHPKPIDEVQDNLFKWILGKEFKVDLLPEKLRHFEAYKNRIHATNEIMSGVPDVPFQMLTALTLGIIEWTQIAVRSSWQTARMNLNTFKRHGVFNAPEITKIIADKLRNPELVQKSRVYPYQLMSAYMHIEQDMPYAIREAIQDALEIATQNVPELKGNVVIGVDISGSMNSPVTGRRGTATSKMRYVDVAALFGATLLRKNPGAILLPFHGEVVNMQINPRDTILTNAEKLAAACTNGTNCAAPLKWILDYKKFPNTVIIVSDSESWMSDSLASPYNIMYGTDSMRYWRDIKQINPHAKIICINISPTQSVQLKSGIDIFNIGGFSDAIFDLIANIVNETHGDNYFVDMIKKELPDM